MGVLPTAIMAVAALLTAFVSTAPAQPAEDAATEEATNAEASEEEDPGATDEEAELELSTLEEMELPSAEQLLRGQPVDWIVLKQDQDVIVAEPVTPRPDTLGKIQEMIDEKSKQRRTLSGGALAALRDEIEALGNLRLQLVDQLEDDYLLPVKLIEEIIHHEDLVLRRVDVIIGERDYDLAYELLNVLLRRTPDWPGALQRHNALLFDEAARKVEAGDYAAALVPLEEIHSRAPQFGGLVEQTGTVIDHLIEKAIADRQWRQARHFRSRLQAMFPDHPSVGEWRARLNETAEQHLSQAEQARLEGDHALALSYAEQAALTWPSYRNLRARYRRYSDRHQRLRVGVLDLPSVATNSAVIRPHANERAAHLSEIPFFEVDHAEDGAAHYDTRFCDRWEPLNLGREVLFELRDTRQPWEAQPVVTAPLIAGRIAARLDPARPGYDERLAGYVDSVEVHGPYSFTLRFDRVPVRTEALLGIGVVEAFPREMRGDSIDDPSAVSVISPHGEGASLTRVTGGFQLAEQTTEHAVYRRAQPEPDDIRQYHLAEIQEQRYANADAALRALLRGEVSMLVRAPAAIVDLLRDDEQMLKAFFVEKMAVPLTHLVQFHPHSRPLKVREYRRALAYSIDRQRILSETVLRNAASDLGRVVNGPMPSRSDANNALVQTRTYDPLAAFSLMSAARKQLGGELPPLRMAVVDDPVARAAAAELVDTWSRFGFEVEVVPIPEGPLVGEEGDEPQWDLLYRTGKMVEPVTQLWPFLTLTGRAQVSDLDPFPDWLRQEIISLDLAVDWRAAQQIVGSLHLNLWGEVMLLPLWEVDEYLIYRKHVRGVPVSPVHCYADADRWVIESWFAEDAP